jgi:hypothetical protein
MTCVALLMSHKNCPPITRAESHDLCGAAHESLLLQSPPDWIFIKLWTGGKCISSIQKLSEDIDILMPIHVLHFTGNPRKIASLCEHIVDQFNCVACNYPDESAPWCAVFILETTFIRPSAVLHLKKLSNGQQMCSLH